MPRVLRVGEKLFLAKEWTIKVKRGTAKNSLQSILGVETPKDWWRHDAPWPNHTFPIGTKITVGAQHWSGGYFWAQNYNPLGRSKKTRFYASKEEIAQMEVTDASEFRRL